MFGNKKGGTFLGIPMEWILLIIFLGVVSMILFGTLVPQATKRFFGTVGKTATNVYSAIFGQERAAEGDKFVPEDVQKTYLHFFELFETNKGGQKDCLVKYKPFALDQYKIILEKTDKGTNLLLLNNVNQEVGFRHVGGLFPCLVAPKDPTIDADQYVAFDRLVLYGSNSLSDTIPESHGLFSGQPYLYKAAKDDGHLCFFVDDSVKDPTSGKRYDNTFFNPGFDDGDIEAFTRQYPICS